ncbi:hypothetical protein FGG08_000078 [Glutinoglossum americanum]|uniref:Uncharacterized protein n=1 Tax=Glutinoglossum americanum TaxID=1670608 RepID=A0A9P8IB11_9PEZI|nr:hypothetical protein FGG08_000078 [Glutinoglossum americanum]
MLFSKTSILAVAMGLTACVDAHMLMANPKPYDSQNTAGNGPLRPDGSNFPCKGETSYAAGGSSNTWPLGSTQTLKTIGQAVHGGGSCQISITYDKQPNKSSVWKVIHSIHGGCPARNTPGNLGDSASASNPDTYDFKIPDGLPTGEAVVAWTWFNKVGNPEMYMNCAPVQITGGSSKRSESEADLVVRDTAFLDSLPNMFKANIGNGCGTAQQGMNVVFPNPGSSLETNAGPFDPTKQFTGDCAAANGPGNAVAPSPAPDSAPSSTAAGAPAPTNTGGIFAQPSAAPTTLVTSPAPAAPTGSIPAPAPPGPGGDSATGCTTANYGKTICSADGNQIGTCDYGGKIVMGSVATGTKCVNGALVAARSVAIRGRYVRFAA